MDLEVPGSIPGGGTILDFPEELLERVRADTPNCARLTCLDNAGMSLTPQPVLNTVFAHLAREQRLGGYRAAHAVRKRLESGYASLAAFVGGRASEIAFVMNATRAWDLALASLELGEGDRVIAHASEYVSNRFALARLARRGVEVDWAGSRPDGTVDPDSVAALIRSETRLVCITHVPSTRGIVNPAGEIGRLARAAGVPYLLDACQSAGQIPLDVEALGCDMLAATGRKFLRGPRGTGFLWVREAMLDKLDPPFPDYTSAVPDGRDGYVWVAGARRFETFEHPVAARLGFIRAVEYALELGLEAIADRVAELARHLRETMREIGMEGVETSEPVSGIVTFHHPRLDPREALAALAERDIVVSVSARHGREPRRVLRASVHYYNTSTEIDRLAVALGELVTAH